MDVVAATVLGMELDSGRDTDCLFNKMCRKYTDVKATSLAIMLSGRL